MICAKCGKDVGESKFCPECGTKIEIEEKSENIEKADLNGASVQSADESPDSSEQEAISASAPDIQSANYYEALKKIEDEKEAKKKKKKKKKAIGCASAFLAIVLLCFGLFLTNWIKSDSEIKSAIASDEDYQDLIFKKYENQNIDSKYYKWAKYALKKDNNDAFVFFLNKCSESEDEEIKDRAFSFLEKNVKKFIRNANYSEVISCIPLYEKFGKEFDDNRITEFIEKCVKNKDKDNFTALIKYIEENEIDCKKDFGESVYSFANEYYENGNYENAFTLYSLYEGKEEISDKLKKCKYELGINAFNDGSYSEALDYLKDFYGDNKEYKKGNMIYIWILVQNAKKDTILPTARYQLKSRLRDPASYWETSASEHSSVNVTDDNPPEIKVEISAIISYRAKNGFGGYVLDTYHDEGGSTIEAKGLTYDEADKLVKMSTDDLK